jgi:hypothetical protein
MQLVGVALVLISIGTILAPIGAVVIMYRDNLPQIVIPAEITDLMNGNSSSILSHYGVDEGNLTSDQGSFLAPVFVSSEIDNTTRTFNILVNFTNSFTFNLTLNEVSAGIACSEHNFLLGNVSVVGPINISSGETAQIHITGSWTQEAENHFITLHPNQDSINVNLIDLTVNVNGLIIHQTEPVNIGDIAFAQGD